MLYPAELRGLPALAPLRCRPDGVNQRAEVNRLRQRFQSRLRSANANGMFVLGVGAQKAATTWLHRLLKPGLPMKEFHVWNTLYGPPGSTIEKGYRFDNSLRQAMLADTEFYFDTFARGGVDITPSYAALSAETFGLIRDGFDRRGADIVPIFIMRDPVDRLWSAWQMYRQRGLTDLDLAAYAESPAAQAHGSYHHTVEALDQAFDDPWYGFFETLFDEGIASLAVRLGKDFDDEALAQHHNRNPSPSTLTEKDRAMLRQKLDPIYQFCFDRFPVTRSLWDQRRD